MICSPLASLCSDFTWILLRSSACFLSKILKDDVHKTDIHEFLKFQPFKLSLLDKTAIAVAKDVGIKNLIKLKWKAIATM